MSDSDASTEAAIANRRANNFDCAVSVLTTDIQVHSDFSSCVTLFGRRTQTTSLLDAYERASMGKSEVVLIHGVSGTGKSSLVDSLRRVVTFNDSGYFVTGKFDQLQTVKEPFSAVSAAISDVCDLILQSDPFDIRRREIISALGSDGMILSRVVSSITKIMCPSNEGRDQYTVNTEDFLLFKQACIKFFRVASSEAHPILIFLDDIQWADEFSIEVIRALISDEDSKHTLFCIAYRDNEFDGKDALGLNNDLSEVLNVTELKVTNLDVEDIGSMLIHLLYITSDSVEPLSHLILQKTDGNPHAIVNLLNFLARKELLVYSNESYCWKWNLALIETEVSDDPKEIIAKKICILEADVQEILRLASYIGHSFQLRVLFYSKWYGISVSDSVQRIDDDTNMERLRNALESAKSIGLLEEVSPGKYKFLHDSYQDYLYHSVDSDTERGAIHLLVGRGISKLLKDSQEDQETLLVVAANNFILSSGLIKEDSERLEILHLLYSAANTAASKMSLNNALQFLSYGISLISESDWSTNYEICIDLYNTNAEILSLAGSFEECNDSVQILLQRSLMQKDRLRAHYTKIRCLGFRNDVAGMLKYAFQKVMKNELGEAIPLHPSFARLAIEFARTRSELKILKPESFLTLPEMTDETKVAVLHVYAIILPYMFTYSQSLYLYTILRQIRLSIKFGISPITASALASYALISKSMGNVDVANQFETVAMELSKRAITSFAARSIAIFAVAGFLLPSRLHLYEIVESMLESYEHGWKSNSERTVAFYSITGYLEMQYYLGMPLANLERDLKKYCQQMKEYQANQMWTANIILWQFTLNLLGQSNDPSILTGEVMNAKIQLESAKRENDDVPLRSISFYQMILSLSFEDWDQLKDVVPVTIKNLSKQKNYFDFLLLASQIVLAALSLYKKTSLRKYITMARSHIKMIGRQFSGVPDAKPLLSFLNAEWSAIIDKKDTTKEFDQAITELKDIRFIAFETLAYQRVMHLNLREGNIRKAKNYLVQSIERNREWGNIAKVEWLESTYSMVLASVKPFHEIKLIHK